MSKTIWRQAAEFFYANAGFSYDPKTESPEQGRKRCSEALATAERDGASSGFTFEWTEDDGEFSDDDRHVQLWICICRHKVGDALATLGGIDLGEEEPPQAIYCRVIQAELAMQALAYIAKDDQDEAPTLQEIFDAMPLKEQLNSAIEELDQDKTTREELEHYVRAIRAAFGWLPDDKRKALIEELRRTR